MTLITSPQNPKIKQVRALGSRKARREQGLFVVEGIRHIGEAFEAHAQFEYLLYAADMLTSAFAFDLVTQLELTGTPVFKTTPDILTRLADKDNPQGILAVVRHSLTLLASLNPLSFSWGVALASPQDPGNLGTILRTLDSAGADGLIVLDNGVDIHHPTAVRASMGTLFWKPVVYASFEEFAAWAREYGYHLYGSSTHGDTDYQKAEYQRPAILLLGSEREGLTEEQAAACERVLRLPMHGKATSLNLSVAAGILLYQMEAQFKP